MSIAIPLKARLRASLEDANNIFCLIFALSGDLIVKDQYQFKPKENEGIEREMNEYQYVDLLRKRRKITHQDMKVILFRRPPPSFSYSKS